MDFKNNNANVPLEGTKNIGESLSKQVSEIVKTKQNIDNANKFINELKNKYKNASQRVIELQEELKKVRAEKNSQNFKNAGQKVIDNNKKDIQIGAFKERINELNKEIQETKNKMKGYREELTQYKASKDQYEKQLSGINNTIQANNNKLIAINSELENLIASTSMKFNMRSTPKVEYIYFPNKKARSKRKRRKTKTKTKTKTRR